MTPTRLGGAHVPDDDLVLSNHTFKIDVGFETSGSIRLGPNLTISGPDGRLRLVAGDRVIFENGVRVESGGELVVAVEAGDKSGNHPPPTTKKRPGFPRAVPESVASSED